MKLLDNPGDNIKKVGPNSDEVKLIREMHADGASLKDVVKAFPSIEPEALERWLKSLEAEVDVKTAPPTKPAAPTKPPVLTKPAAPSKPDPLA